MGLELFNIKSKEIDWVRILYHIGFWITILVFFTFITGYPNNYFAYFKGTLVSLQFDIIAVYVTIYFLLPKYLIKRKYGHFILSLFALITAIVIIERLHFVYVDYGKNRPPVKFFSLGILHWYVYVLVIVFIGLVVKLTKNWQTFFQNTKKLESEKLAAELKLKETELSLLKAQNQPQFLFNTLNKLHELTLKKSDHAPEVVLKLSALLDYMLYECNAEEVSLRKEIEQIKNFIALEKLRSDKTIDVNLEIAGDINHQKITPLLLFPFIENSFRQCAANAISHPFIRINLNISKVNFAFFIKNSKSISDKKPEMENDILKGIQERIQIAYHKNYELNIEEKEDICSVELILKSSR